MSFLLPMGSRKNRNSWMGQDGVMGLFHFLWSNQRGSRASRGHNVTEGQMNTKNTIKRIQIYNEQQEYIDEKDNKVTQQWDIELCEPLDDLNCVWRESERLFRLEHAKSQTTVVDVIAGCFHVCVCRWWSRVGGWVLGIKAWEVPSLWFLAGAHLFGRCQPPTSIIMVHLHTNILTRGNENTAL